RREPHGQRRGGGSILDHGHSSYAGVDQSLPVGSGNRGERGMGLDEQGGRPASGTSLGEPEGEPVNHSLATIPEAIEDLRQGRMIILVDDEDRENEGDLVLAAEKV